MQGGRKERRGGEGECRDGRQTGQRAGGMAGVYMERGGGSKREVEKGRKEGIWQDLEG